MYRKRATDETAKVTVEEKVLALARQAFREYYARCFWYLDPEFEVRQENLGLVAEGLRKHGDRKAFQLAERICP